MYRNLLTVLRVSFGLTLLMIGIIGLFLPVLQGGLLIFIAIPIISPAHGKKMAAKLKEWKTRFFSKQHASRRFNSHRQP